MTGGGVSSFAAVGPYQGLTMTIFSNAIRDQLGDSAEAALTEGRGSGFPDWHTREHFIAAAGVAFDVAAEPPAADSASRPDAQP